MRLPQLIAQHPQHELRTVLELIESGGPYASDHTRLIRNLHAYRFANAQATESRYEDGVHTGIIAAQLTERGQALLDDLRRREAEPNS